MHASHDEPHHRPGALTPRRRCPSSPMPRIAVRCAPSLGVKSSRSNGSIWPGNALTLGRRVEAVEEGVWDHRPSPATACHSKRPPANTPFKNPGGSAYLEPRTNGPKIPRPRGKGLRQLVLRHAQPLALEYQFKRTASVAPPNSQLVGHVADTLRRLPAARLRVSRARKFLPAEGGPQGFHLGPACGSLRIQRPEAGDFGRCCATPHHQHQGQEHACTPRWAQRPHQPATPFTSGR